MVFLVPKNTTDDPGGKGSPSQQNNGTSAVLARLEALNKEIQLGLGNIRQSPSPGSTLGAGACAFSGISRPGTIARAAGLISGAGSPHDRIPTQAKELEFTIKFSENLLAECRRLQAAHDSQARELLEWKKKYCKLAARESDIESNSGSSDENDFKGKFQRFMKLNLELKSDLEASQRATGSECSSLINAWEKDAMSAQLRQAKAWMHTLESQLNLRQDTFDKSEYHHMEDSSDDDTLTCSNTSERHLANEEMIKILENSDQYKVISKSEYDELLHPRLEKVKDLADELQCKLIQNQAYDDLNNPSTDRLIKMIEERGLMVLEESSYESLLNPDIETLKDRLTGHELVEKSVYKDLLEKSCNPSLEYLTKQAFDIGYRILSVDSYEKLHHNPSEEELENHAKIYGKTLVDASSFAKMRAELTDPPKDFLEVHAAKKRLKLISETKFEKLTHPTIEDLKGLAEAMNFTLLEKSTHRSIMDSIENPSINYLQTKCASLDYKMIKTENYEELQRMYDHPTISHTKSKLPTYEIIPKDEYKRKMERLTSPSISFLKDKAHMLHHIVVPLDEYKDLERRVIGPTREELAQYATNIGCILISDDHYKTITTPTRYMVRDYGERVGFAVMEKSEYENLRNLANDEKAIMEKVESYGYVALKREDLENLKTSSLLNSSIDEISRFLEPKGYICLSVEEHRKAAELDLNNVTKEQTLELCERFNYKPLGLEEFNELNQARECLNSEVELKNRLESLGYSIILRSELDELKTNLQYPGLEYLKDKCDALGMIVVNVCDWNDAKSRLNSMPLEELTQMASKIGYSVIPQLELARKEEELANPSINYLKLHAEMNQMVLLSQEKESEYELLLSEPPIEFLKSKAAQKHMRLLDFEEYTIMQRKIDYPTRAELEEQAKKQCLVLLSNDKYEMLNKNSNYTLPQMRQKLKTLGYSAIKTEKFEIMRTQCENPSLEYLEEKLKSLDYILISKVKYSDMQNQIAEPSLDAIRFAATSNGCELIDSENYKELIQQLDSPTVDFLSEKAQKHGKSLISFEILDEMKNTIDNPSEQFLLNSAEKIGKTLVARETWNQMNEFVNSPTYEYLEANCRRIGKSMIDATFFSDMSKIKDWAANNHLVILGEEEFEDVKRNNESSNEALRNKVKLLEDRLENPSIDDLMNGANKNDYIIIRGTRLNDMFGSVDYPVSMKELQKIVENDDIELLIQPRLLEKEANEAGIDPVSMSRNKIFFEDIARQERAKTIFTERAKALNLVALSIDEYKSLTNLKSKNELTETDLRCRAQELELKVMTKSEYQDLRSQSIITKGTQVGHKFNKMDTQHNRKTTAYVKDERIGKVHGMAYSKEEMIDWAKKCKLVVLTKEEFSHLNSFRYVELTAQRYNKVLLSEAKYTKYLNISRQVNSPTLEFLRALAHKINCVTLKDDVVDLQEYAKRHGLLLLTKAEQKSLENNLTKLQFESRGYVVLTKQQYIQLKKPLSGGTYHNMAQIKKWARSQGYVCISERNLVATTLHDRSNSITDGDLVGIPRSYYEILHKRQALGLSYFNDDILKQEAKKRGYQMSIKRSRAPTLN